MDNSPRIFDLKQLSSHEISLPTPHAEQTRYNRHRIRENYSGKTPDRTPQ